MTKKILKTALVLIGCLLVACFILEAMLEKIYDVGNESLIRGIPIRENLPNINVTGSKDAYYNGIYGVEGVFNGLGEYHAVIDANGFVEPSKIHENPDKTIIFLGGSTTECITVAEEKRYPYLVGRMLENETEYLVNSYNAGVGGGNSHNSIDTFIHKGLHLQPDMAILHHNINDLIILLKHNDYCYNQNNESFDFYYMQTAGTINTQQGVLARLFPAITRRISALKQPMIVNVSNENSSLSYDRKLILDSFKKNLEIFIAICEINDITPVLMTQASRMDTTPDELITLLYEACGGYELGIEYSEFYALWREMNQVIRDTAVEKNVLCIDLENNIESTQENFYDMVHYTDLGSERVAEVIYRELSALIK